MAALETSTCSEKIEEVMDPYLTEYKNLNLPTDGNETISRSGKNYPDVTMRKSTVRPITVNVADDADKEKEQGKNGDSSDGYDPLSSESLGPLLSSNQYGMRKMAAQALMDVALMMANISQLRTLLTAGEKMENYVVLLVLVIMSLALQLFFALLIFVIWMRESDQHQREEFLHTFRQVVEATKDAAVADKDKIRNSIMNQKKHFKENIITSHLNYVSMVLVFIITVVNMFITGFGLKLEETTAK